MEPVVVVTGLRKSYRTGHIVQGRRPVLLGLDLTIDRGEIFGYIGPNGSGKTTTIKVLMGLVFPDSGKVTVFDRRLEDPSWRHRVGYLPEHPNFYDYLTAGEYLDYAGRLFGLASRVRRHRARELLSLVGLAAYHDLPLRRFSRGMVQRVGLAQALINDPELVILDEPMSGLDPIGRRLVRDIILELKRRGKTVFFSTHILSDAEALCDRVAVLRAGSLLRVGTLSEILSLDVSHFEILASGGAIEAGCVLPPGVRSLHLLGERARFEVAEDAVVSVLTWVRERGGRILAVQPIRESLEDFFFKELEHAPVKGDGWLLQD